MKQDKTIEESKELVIQEPQALDKPQKDTQFAHEAAKFLVDIIKKNNWSRKLGGQSEHIQYEGWQTAGKYYGYSVKTYDAEYVEFGETWGFKAKATVVNEITGVTVGGAEAYCMNDENNWRNKPKFQLASMAQTRAGSKALRQNLGFVVALAGYNPTPAEEMDGVKPFVATQQTRETVQGEYMITDKQKDFIKKLLSEKGFTEKNLLIKYEINSISELTGDQASTVISNLMKLEKGAGKKIKTHSEVPPPIRAAEDIIDVDEVDAGIQESLLKN